MQGGVYMCVHTNTQHTLFFPLDSAELIVFCVQSVPVPLHMENLIRLCLYSFLFKSWYGLMLVNGC